MMAVRCRTASIAALLFIRMQQVAAGFFRSIRGAMVIT
jgi:hypothetical protein